MLRGKTRVVNIGGVKIGGNNPVAIQSMTKVKTADVKKTVSQIKELEKSGCEIIRVAVKDVDDAKAIKNVVKKINIPLVADIHFDHRLALLSIASGASKIRINPGNMLKKEHVVEVINAAKKKKIPIRIGLNSGSSDEKKFIENMKKELAIFEEESFEDIVLSLKSSKVAETVAAYRQASQFSSYPLHLGVTAAGSDEMGIVKSSIGIGALLLDGIGDTIRVSLTGDPVKEVIAAKNILQAIEVRRFGPNVISCPTCGRCQVDLAKVVHDVENKLNNKNFGFRISDFEFQKKPFTIAIMGCEVNGPGEAKSADLGIAFGKDSGIIFKDGKVVKKVTLKNCVNELIKLLK